MDAYSGYNQIKMNPLDAPHTAFMTNTCNYFYKVMPFGLKNAGATYQRLMDRVFAKQIGKNLEVYIDDMVIKTTDTGCHGEDLEEILSEVRRYDMRLNPAKCSFGVQAGKFLGFMLTNRGIEANPEKCKAIIEMRSPSSVKEVHKLTGRIAALSRFLSFAGENAFHFFAGRMVAWAVELSEYDISYTPRGSIKSQVLADFVLEMTSLPPEENTAPWTLSVDGASNLRGSGAGVVLEGPDGKLIEQSLRFAFRASNNQAEYEALIAGMKLAKEMEVPDLKVKSDSQLITNQVAGEYQTKDPQLAKYLEKLKGLAKQFNTFELVHVPIEQNSRADLLSKLTSTKKPGNNRTVIQEIIKEPSINGPEVRIMVIEEGD
jgi:ribonuclease HI